MVVPHQVSVCDEDLVLLYSRAERPPPSVTETTPGPLCFTASAGHPTRSRARPLGGRISSGPSAARRPYPIPAARTRPEWRVCARFHRLTPPSRPSGDSLWSPPRRTSSSLVSIGLAPARGLSTSIQVSMLLVAACPRERRLDLSFVVLLALVLPRPITAAAASDARSPSTCRRAQPVDEASCRRGVPKCCG